jgi:hypothetical protein
MKNPARACKTRSECKVVRGGTTREQSSGVIFRNFGDPEWIGTTRGFRIVRNR